MISKLSKRVAFYFADKKFFDNKDTEEYYRLPCNTAAKRGYGKSL